MAGLGHEGGRLDRARYADATHVRGNLTSLVSTYSISEVAQIRAAVVERAGEVPQVQDIELSDVVHDEVLIRISTTGICHTDLAWQSGQLESHFPVVLGHETAGVVEAVGPQCTRFRKGDRVGVALTHHCGHCARCEEGHPILCLEASEARPRHHRDGVVLYQGFGTGGFAEKTVVRERSLVKIPDGMPLEIAALVGCAVSTGIGVIWNIARVEPGTRVAVFGCGGIGASAIMASAVAGAETIVAVDPSDQRRELALGVGATEACEPDLERLLSLAPDGFDYVIECAGREEAMEMALRATRPGGTTAVVGVLSPAAVFGVPGLDFVGKQKRLVGCLTGDVRPHLDWDRYFRLYLRGRLPLDALITHRVSLDEIADGFERAERAEGIRIMVNAP